MPYFMRKIAQEGLAFGMPGCSDSCYSKMSWVRSVCRAPPEHREKLLLLQSSQNLPPIRGSICEERSKVGRNGRPQPEPGLQLERPHARK